LLFLEVVQFWLLVAVISGACIGISWSVVMYKCTSECIQRI